MKELGYSTAKYTIIIIEAVAQRCSVKKVFLGLQLY